MTRSRRVLLSLRIASVIIVVAALVSQALLGRVPQKDKDKWNLKLWYKQPAKKWTEALPVGNGRLGAMVFGETEHERIQLNESSVWTGGPYDPNHKGDPKALLQIRKLVFDGKYYEAQHLFGRTMMGYPIEQQKYQSLGNLWLTFPGHDTVTDYRRELDLDKAIATVRYSVDGVMYTREVFSSAIDQVVIIRLTADKPGKIAFSALLYGERNPITYDDNNFTSDPVAPNQIVLRGKTASFLGIEGRVHYVARLVCLNDGGSVSTDYTSLNVNGANSVTLILAAATNFVNYHDLSADPEAKVAGYLAAVSGKTYEYCRSAHIAEHQRLFHRMSITLDPGPSSDLPTDERIKKAGAEDDPQLAALVLQFGRYLLISSSRPGGEPANLQGLWNQDMNPWWESKYTTNINLEMNYWPVETLNLSECAEPLFNLIRDVSVTGQKTAQVKYGAQGWVLHQNTDIWRATAPMDGPTWGTLQTGGAWLCTHLWEHYLFSGDTAFLRKYYSIVKGSVEFFEDVLVEDHQHHWLVTCPSMSPENFPQWGDNHRYLDETCGLFLPGTTICAGPTMDMSILRSLFDSFVSASKILGEDKEMRTAVAGLRDRLAPLQIGKSGELQEWLEDWTSLEPKHRHLSLLWGLYPGNEISPTTTPAFAEASQKSLIARGEGGCGWSIAWKLGLWARLLDGERAYTTFRNLMTNNVYPDLFSRCGEAMQVDGNFAASAAIAEMILQSQSGEISILPAIPKAWKNGSVVGIQARGGFEVDIDWRDGKLVKATLHSSLGNTIHVRYGTKDAVIKTQKGESIALDKDLNRI